MVTIKKIFQGGLNSDASAKTLGEGQMLNLQCARWGISEDGRNNRLESIRGTTLIAQSVLPSGTHLTLGSTIDDSGKRILYLNWNSGGEHGIYCYDQTSGLSYKVLLNSQVTGGLNFSKSNRIDRNARVIAGMLYFTDGTENGQRKVNIDAGIKLNHPSYATAVAAYTSPLNFSEITLIKPPPALAPTIQKNNDTSFANNFIANVSVSFTFQYIYRDNEKSVVGAYSRASRLNKKNDVENRIIVKMDGGENIPQTVSIVRLIARMGSSAFVAKTWDKNIAAEATEITNHNAGTTLLTYNFYNDSTGEFISQGDILKPYDSVPRSTKTIETAKDRLFLGNNTDGYDTPKTTSLTHSFSLTDITLSGLKKNLVNIDLEWGEPRTYSYKAWAVIMSASEMPVAGYYVITSTVLRANTTGSLSAAPIFSPFSGLTFVADTQRAFIDKIVQEERDASYNVGVQYLSQFTNTNFICTITGLEVNTFDIFKTRAQYQVGVTFYDFAMRKCGVVKSTDTISIPPRDYSFNQGVRSVALSVSNTNALAEIPDWAYYYSFPRTLNLRTRFFIQSYDTALRYVTKTPSGEYKYDQTTFVSGCFAVGIDTTILVQSGLGYSYSEGSGDICYLLTSSSSSFNILHQLAVTGQDGKYILLTPVDLGDLTTMTASYEIYTPYLTSEQEPYFEMGSVFKVSNPTTNSRAYSVTSDVMLPDAYVLARAYLSSTYFAEAMCPNDVFYKRWDNDGGKVNLITKLGARNKTQSVYWSNTYLAGTAVNGLNTFEPLNQKTLPLELGAISKLQAANKIAEQGQGSVMLAICEASQTASLYLGEVQLSASAKSSDIIRSDEVIGSINVLSGSWGTTHPETVIEYGGLVFWIDTVKRAVVQYSGNGLDSVSKFNMVRFFEKYLKDYDNTSSSAIDTLNGFHHIPTAIDPSFRKELVIITPALVAESAMTDLPSYSGTPSYATSIKNRFDVCDKQGKAIGYSIEGNIWQHTYPYACEWTEYLGNNSYSFKNGFLYKMDDDNVNWNKFFGGDSAPIRLCFPLNEIVGGDVEFVSLVVEASEPPTYAVIYANSPIEQITDLVSADFIRSGSAFYAKVFRDRLSPNVTGSADEKLFSGDIISGYPLFIMMEWNVNSRMVTIDAIDLGCIVSNGIKSIIQK